MLGALFTNIVILNTLSPLFKFIHIAYLANFAVSRNLLAIRKFKTAGDLTLSLIAAADLC